MKSFLTLAALLAICGCSVTQKPAPTPTPATQAVTSQPVFEPILKALWDGEVRTAVYTHCDYCNAPFAAPTKPELLKQMAEAGWCLDQYDNVVCRRCAIEIGKMGFH